MSRIHHRSTALSTLVREVVEEALSRKDVKVRGELVNYTELERAKKLEHNPHLLALAVRALMHAPVKVDTEHANQLVAPDRVIVLPLLHHIPRRNVHGVGLDRIETSTPPLPHTAQVRHAIRLVVRQRISVDVELVKLEGREEAAADHSGEDAKQRTLSGAVRPDQDDLRVWRDDTVQPRNVRFVLVVREVQVLDVDDRLVGDGGRFGLHGRLHGSHRCVGCFEEPFCPGTHTSE
mmetsp:Transcript_62173/g.171016  ORF Transcript_62173/g.171016 Transcript_62173/m.171016 type:complete len:235 (+) Transcript_62173:579-1283(+)